MSKNKHVTKMFLLLFAVLFAAALFNNNSVFAATLNSGIITDANDIRWEYELIDNPDDAEHPQTLSIRFYDKPANLNKVTVPSLANLISLVPNVSADLDTYFLKDADATKQDAAYTDVTRRTPTTETTILDMQNTAKIQILGVKPIINPEVETELIFGEQMVLGDQLYKSVTWTRCDMNYSSSSRTYRCGTGSYNDVNLILYRDSIDNWYSMTDAEWEAYEPTTADVGRPNCYLANDGIPYSQYVSNRCYITIRSENGGSDSSTNQYTTAKRRLGRAFSGYKLKLTNFTGANFNYVGWETFKDSTLHDTTVTIDSDTFLGSDIFRNTNVTKAIIKSNTIGSGVFRDCANLTTIEFDDSVTRVTESAFAKTGITSLDFGTTHIKTVSPYAFAETTSLTSIDFTGIENIEYRAFAKTSVRELYLPKSIKFLGAWLFDGVTTLKKVTIAYDTLTKGTILAFNTNLASSWGWGGQPLETIEELNVIAPYAANDELSPDHISYADYFLRNSPSAERYEQQRVSTVCNATYIGAGTAFNDCFNGQNNDWDQENSLGNLLDFELRYANLDAKKNIIAPRYFSDLKALKKITIGEGYEYIGNQAFFTVEKDESNTTWADKINYCGDDGCNGNSARIDEINLPESLRGVGTLAFQSIWNPNMKMTIPQNIEFIGMAAFRRVFFLDQDVDFPNLVALGDFAFDSTLVHNIVLHDKLQYMGVMVFAECPNINNVTFDLDIFSPDIYISWAKLGRNAHFSGNKFQFRDQFSKSAQSSYYRDKLANWGFRVSMQRPFNDGNQSNVQLGTITFTEKAVNEMPNSFGMRYSDGNHNNDEYNDFFSYVDADKVDMSKAGFKVLSPRIFDHAMIGEVLLPEHLEVIPGSAFQSSIIEEELVIPDSVRIIGDKAFAFGEFGWARYVDKMNGGDWDPHRSCSYQCEYQYTEIPYGWGSTKITKLPASLEYVGNEAFYGDYNLTADLESPNLKRVYIRAFMGTRLRNVYLPESTQLLREATFAAIPTLNDITIDFDLGALPPSSEPNWSDFTWPESLTNYAGANIYHYLADNNFESASRYYSDWRSGTSSITFYTLFNQALEGGQDKTHNKFGKLTFTDNAETPVYMTGTGYFSNLEYEEVDMGAAGWAYLTGYSGEDPVNNGWSWRYAFSDAKIGKLTLPQNLKTITGGSFINAEVDQPFAIPETTTVIGSTAFQWFKGSITNMLPESTTKVLGAAFYGSDVTDELLIPGTVDTIGQAAFNAGDADVHYDLVTLEPDLDFNKAQGQLVHQFMWGSDVTKMIIKSSELPAMVTQDAGHYQEFWHMPMQEVVITNLPTISFGAFEGCTKLEKVDMSQDANLRLIRGEAFLDAEKLHIIKFARAIKDEIVTIGQNAFKGTAFVSMGDDTTEFDLTAAKFDGATGLAFAGMPKLRTLSVPASFSNATIPYATFSDDTALEEATIDWRITRIEDSAFSNDNKLKRIFIWGDTTVFDTNLPGYDAGDFGQGADGDDDEEEESPYGPTIPEGTDIYAYSTFSAEPYAAADARANFEGDFYPLDEVLYLTSNKTYVKLNDNEDDFDKSGLIVYGLRRDGLVLESDSWAEYDGNVYSRNDKDLEFKKMAQTVADNPEFGTVWDTPVPINLLDFSNENYADIDYELVRDGTAEDVRLVNLIYTDKYTEGKPDTDVLPYTGGIIPDGPVTLAENITACFFILAGACGALLFVRKFAHRR